LWLQRYLTTKRRCRLGAKVPISLVDVWPSKMTGEERVDFLNGTSELVPHKSHKGAVVWGQLEAILKRGLNAVLGGP
jgi:hypothetical protein